MLELALEVLKNTHCDTLVQPRATDEFLKKISRLVKNPRNPRKLEPSKFSGFTVDVYILIAIFM